MEARERKRLSLDVATQKPPVMVTRAAWLQLEWKEEDVGRCGQTGGEKVETACEDNPESVSC